jgi:hypothetical protein
LRGLPFESNGGSRYLARFAGDSAFTIEFSGDRVWSCAHDIAPQSAYVLYRWSWVSLGRYRFLFVIGDAVTWTYVCVRHALGGRPLETVVG